MDADFEKLYNAYYMKVYSFVMTLAKNRHDSEEITQKTFFKAMTADKKHSGNSSEFTWLCAIAKNLFLDQARVRKRISELDLKDGETVSETDIEKAFDDGETAFRIHQVLHNLEEPYKEVFGLRIFGELSFQKIGLLFGKTENWARVTYHRARLKVLERMDLS
ncbi:MAG: RNA polymerase sigma factor [Oscillospiraceae bacterium]|nr:RNA polymerase sigma factor [Oscillospiraceae bacterium]